MLFNSHEFIFAFLPFVLVGWYLLRPPTVRLAFLTLCSWFFYAWWDWRFLPLMISSTTVDYIAGRLLVSTDDEGRRKLVLISALSFNLAPRLSSQLAASGLFFFACGLSKKLLVADTLAPHVDKLFLQHSHLGLVTGWAAALGYSLQLYFDFSGYSDMAVGLAFLLGFRFPQNFNSPYRSVNISDFWRRWHMSLSFWLRDYLFIPLGGSHGSRAATLRNLFVTMFLGGLWHGAAWTFVVWGLIHGAYLVIHNLARGAGLTPRSTVVNRAITYACVAAAFVVFRAPTLTAAGDVLGAMAGLHGLGTLGDLRASTGSAFLLEVVGLLVFVNVVPNTWEIKLEPRLRHGLAIGFAAGFAVLLLAQPSPFIYFQF